MLAVFAFESRTRHQPILRSKAAHISVTISGKPFMLSFPLVVGRGKPRVGLPPERYNETREPKERLSCMVNFAEALRTAKKPETFEQYLDQYAGTVGDMVNEFIPHGTHPDMDRYLYGPLLEYSQNGGKHRQY